MQGQAPTIAPPAPSSSNAARQAGPSRTRTSSSRAGPSSASASRRSQVQKSQIPKRQTVLSLQPHNPHQPTVTQTQAGGAAGDQAKSPTPMQRGMLDSKRIYLVSKMVNYVTENIKKSREVKQPIPRVPRVRPGSLSMRSGLITEVDLEDLWTKGGSSRFEKLFHPVSNSLYLSTSKLTFP